MTDEHTNPPPNSADTGINSEVVPGPETREMKEGAAPYIVRQTLVRGKDRPMLVVTAHRLHDFVVGRIPEEVLQGQAKLLESHEVSVWPSDPDGLKRGKHLQKKRFPSEAEALKNHEQNIQAILKGEYR